MTAAASTSPQASTEVAAVSASKPVAPAAVPPWLSGNSAGLLSQQASATLGAPFGQNQPAYARRLSGYPSMHRYRTLDRSEEHTAELQSLMRISYYVFCLKKKKKKTLYITRTEEEN